MKLIVRTYLKMENMQKALKTHAEKMPEKEHEITAELGLNKNFIRVFQYGITYKIYYFYMIEQDNNRLLDVIKLLLNNEITNINKIETNQYSFKTIC